MPTYQLRLKETDGSAALWRQATERATKEGRTLRGVMLWLLTKYVKGQIPK